MNSLFMMTSHSDELFCNAPLPDLNHLIIEGRAKSASRILILAGKPLLFRINGELTPPLNPTPLHFKQTQSLAGALLSPEQVLILDEAGAVEIQYSGADIPAAINIFFGDGAHNLIVFLD